MHHGFDEEGRALQTLSGTGIWTAIRQFARRVSDDIGGRWSRWRRHKLLRSRDFDHEWYLARNPDAGAYNGSPYEHFVRHGLSEGRNGRFFDSEWYFQAHGDLVWSRLDAWSHYRKFGQAEGRPVRYLYVSAEVEHFRNRDYREWRDRYCKAGRNHAKRIHGLISKMELNTRFQLALVIDSFASADDCEQWLKAAAAQSYDKFSCKIGMPPGAPERIQSFAAQLAAKDKRFSIEVLKDQNGSPAANQLLFDSDADYVAAFSVRTRLDQDALFWLSLAVRETGHPKALFGDDDVLYEGELIDPHFKPQMNPELNLTQDLIGGALFISPELFARLNGYQNSGDVASNHDLGLRALELEGRSALHRVPRILSHIVGKREPVSLDIVQRRLEQRRQFAVAEDNPEAPGYARIKWRLPARQPSVTVIIPTRDRVDLLKMCVSSLLEKTDYRNFDVIIIDNGSVEPETIAYLNSLPASRVRVIRDERAFNFSSLNNLAVREAKGKFVCLLNNDIEINSPDWLKEMVSVAGREDIGCVGARLWYPNGAIQHAGVLVGFHGVAGHLHKNLPREDTGYRHLAVLQQEVAAVTAACLLVKRAIYCSVGGMDENLAVAFNDVDFCLRVRAAGYRNIYAPFAELIHHESASRGADTTPEKRAREKSEIDFMKARWGDALLQDPTFSPNLSLTAEDISFAFPPRVPDLTDLETAAGIETLPEEWGLRTYMKRLFKGGGRSRKP